MCHGLPSTFVTSTGSNRALAVCVEGRRRDGSVSNAEPAGSDPERLSNSRHHFCSTLSGVIARRAAFAKHMKSRRPL